MMKVSSPILRTLWIVLIQLESHSIGSLIKPYSLKILSSFHLAEFKSSFIVSSGFAHSDCDIVADSPNEGLDQCFHAHDNTCAAFVEEDCVYNGTDTGTDEREIKESL